MIKPGAKKPSQGNKLTAKQEMFCREYLVDLNASQACLRAGYSEKSHAIIGWQLLKKNIVTERIQSLKQERAKSTQITAEYVLTTIQATIERCKQSEPVKDKDGNVTGEYKYDSAAVLKGAELLGKHLAMWTDKQQISADVTLSTKSDDELDKMLDHAIIALKAGGKI